MLRWLFLLFIFLLIGGTGLAQTVINVDLTASPNITKTFTGYNRSGSYCNDNNCIVFNITLNPKSDLVSFTESQGSGASFYSVDCGPVTPIGVPVCITGKTQVTISFCKPGGNNLTYTISASTAVKASADATVRQGCPKVLDVTGLDPATVTWTSIAPGAQGQYNSFLSCTSGCATTTFTANATSPAYIDYKVSGVTSACPNSKSDTVRVYVTSPMTVSFNSASTAICSGASATLAAMVAGGSAPYTYAWKKDGNALALTTASISVNTVGTYMVTVSDDTDCSPVSQSIIVTAAPTPAAPTAAGTAICTGSTATLTATAPGGTYQWFSTATGGTALFTGAAFTTPALSSTTTYYVETSLNGCTSSRTAVTVTVNPIPVAPTAAGTTICSGTSATLSATAPGGSYQWYDAPTGGNLLGSNSSFTTPILNTTTTYYVQTTVNNCTSARKAVTVTVNQTPNAPTASGTTICSGTSTTLTATAPGGAYDWYDVATGGTSLISGSTFTTPTLTATKTYYVQTSVNGCPSIRTAVTVNVNPIPVAPTAAGMALCTGSTITLTATAPGGTYQWFSAVTGGTALFTGAAFTTPALSATTTYYVQTTVNGCTSTRTAVTATVNPIPATPTAAGTTICSGTSATLSATAPGGIYEWYDAASGGNLLVSNSSYTTPLLNATTTYYVQTTVNGCNSSRRAVTVTVKPTPVAPTANGTTICSGTSTTLTATAAGGSFEWYDAVTGGNLLSNTAAYTTPALTAVTTYYVQNTVNGCPSLRTSVTININPLAAAPTTTGDTVCGGSTATLTATAPGGTYRWYSNATGGIPLFTGPNFTTPVLNTTTVYYVDAETAAGCTGPRSAVTASVIPADNPAFSYPSGTFCRTGTDPIPTLAGPSGTFSSTAGLVINTATGEIDVSASTLGTYTISFFTNTTCVYSSTTTVTITDAPVATFSYADFCKGQVGIAMPIFLGGASAGQFSSPDPGLVFFNPSTGEINLAASTPGTYTVTNQIAPTGGCAAATATSTVTIKPTPVINSAPSGIICSNTAQQYTIISTVTTATFSWSRAAVAGISNAPMNGQTTALIDEILINTTAAPINVVYTIVPSADGCVGPTFNYTVTVKPTPTITSAANAPICNNVAQNYAITSDVTGATFSWSRADVTGIANPSVTAHTSTTITEALMNTTADPIAVVYTIIPSADGCDGPAFIYTLTVNPTPIVTSAASAPICSNIAQNYTIISNVTSATFTWSRAAVSGISNPSVTGQTSTTITEALSNTTVDPIAVVYTIIPSVNGCDGPAFTYTITVNPTPTVTSATSASTCNDVAQNYNITSNVTGATFRWSRADVVGISNPVVTGQTSVTITETLTNTTAEPVDVVYNIVPSANGCDGPAFTYTITVNPTPKITSGASAAMCNNSGQNYSITSAVMGTTFTWGRAAVTGINNGAVSGQTSPIITEALINTTNTPINVAYVIIPAANGCDGPSFTYTVTVKPTPTVTSAASTIICSDAVQNYTIISNVTNANFTWSRAAVTGIANSAVAGQSGSFISEALTNTSNVPIDVVYTIIPSADGCDGPAFTYTVTVKPTPRVTSIASASICNNVAQNYNITSDVTGATFIWSRADVAGIFNPAIMGQAGDNINEALVNTLSIPVNVVYNIIPSANGCDGPTFTYTVTVNPTPTVTSSANASICNNVTQNYNITSNVTGATFIWSRADVAGISNPVITGQAGSNINETLVNTLSIPVNVVYNIIPSANGCDGPAFTYTLTVNPTPTLTSTGSASICNNVAQNYNMTSNVTGATFTWSRADVAGISNAAVTGQTSGTITEALINTTSAPVNVIYNIIPSANGCDGPNFTYTVTVNPTTTVTSMAIAAICNNVAQNYNITSDVTGATFNWSRADVTGIANPAVTGQSSRTIAEALINTTSTPINVIYNIIPSINGCEGPAFTYTITVNPTPIVTSAAIAAICNKVAQNYDMTSNVTGATFTWSRADVVGISNAAVTGQTSSKITEVLINTTSAPINVIYNIIPSANSCDGPAFTYTITINPTPTVTSAANASICNNVAQNYNITSDVAGATFTWSRATIAGISNPAITGQAGNNINEILVNTLSIPVNVVYNIIPSANGCDGPAFTYTITVNPTPIVTSSANASICNNVAQNYNMTSNVTGATFTWSRADVAGISNAAVTGQTSGTITETLSNTTPAPINVVYNIIPTANGCDGPSFTYTITVNPTPTVNSIASASICNSIAQNYNITSDVTGTTFTWSRADVVGISNAAVTGQTSSTITEALINTTSAPINVLYNIVPSSNGCDGPAFTYTININPTPIVTSIASAFICNNVAQNYSITSNVSGASFTWSRATVTGISNAAVTRQTSSITEALINITSAPINVVYNIIPSANGCDGPAFTYTITVNPTPIVTSAASAAICNNVAQNYDMTSNVTGATFTWSRADMAGISNAAVTGQTSSKITEVLINTTSAPINVIYNIIPSANGCDGPAFTYTLTVNPTPTVTSTSSATICSNVAQNYNITSNVTGATFIWSRAAVVGISNPAVTGQTSSTITEALINTTSAPINVVYNIVPSANGCDGPAFTYTLTVNPTPTVTSIPNASICNSVAQNYNITSDVTGTNFNWSRATIAGISNSAVTGQVGNNINEILVNTTSAPVNVVYSIVPSANGCDGPAFTYSITVNPTPTVTSAASASICNSVAQNYNITSNVTGTTFNWSRATVVGISNPAVIGQAGNNINEILVNTTSAPINVVYSIVPSANGCDGPAFTYTITVKPTSIVTSIASAFICNNTAQNYNITSIVTGATFIWSRATVAGISNPAVTGQTSATITEALINTTSVPVNVVYSIVPSANGCDGPAFTYTITVNPTPVVTSGATASICNNTTKNYEITSNVSGASFTWSRAAIAGISNPLITGQTGATIAERLINTTSAPINVIYNIIPSTNGCNGPTFIYTITVSPTPVVTSEATASICNNTPQNYEITSNVSSASFTWSRAAIVGISNPLITGQTGATIAERLINTTSAPINVIYNIIPSTNGCNGPTFIYTITVNPTPTVTSMASASICNNTAQNYTITSNVTGTTFTWSRANVTGISNAAVTGQTSSTITEALINTSSAPVNVVYTIVPSANGCDGPSFTYTITVNPTPIVTSLASASICNNVAQSYNMTSNVTGATFTWSRPTVTGIFNVAVTGQASSTITEALINTSSTPINVLYNIVPSSNGCDGPAFTYTLTVNPTPTVTSAANASICNNTAQNYAITSSVNGASFTWRRADIGGISNPAVTGQTSATITEALINTTSAPVNVIYNIIPSANGCDGPVFTYTITVKPTPTVTSSTSASICNNVAQNYNITSDVTGATFNWSRAAMVGISNPTVIGQAGNNINETLVNTTSAPINVVYNIIPSANGCDGPASTYTITVKPTPTVTSTASASICNSIALNYNITSDVTGTTFTWSRATIVGISNSTVLGQAGNNINETLVNTTSAPINVIYSIIPSANGCDGPTFTYTITVKPTPTVTSAANVSICNNVAQNYNITSNVTGATFIWSRATIAGISNIAVTGQTSSTITEALINTTSAPINVVYNIVPSANGCDGPAFNYTLTVNPTTIVTSVASASVCNNVAQNYNITSNVTGTTFRWSRAAVAGISNPVIAAQTGSSINEILVNTSSAPIAVTYTIVPSINGCDGPAFAYTLTVNPTASISNVPLSQTICSTSSSTAIVPVSPVIGTTFTWNAIADPGITGFVTAGTGTIPAQTLVNNGATNGQVTYTITPIFAGCTGISSKYIITVLNQVPVAPIVQNNSPVCIGQPLTLSVESVNGASYSWKGPNGYNSAEQNPVINNVDLLNEGLYKVTITVGQCSSTANTSVVLNRPALVSVMNDQTVCANNATIQISGTVNGGSTTGIWTTSGTGTFPMGATNLNGTYVPSAADINAGNVKLILSSTNNLTCAPVSATANVLITAAPIVTAGADQNICSNQQVVLNAQSTTALVRWSSSGTGVFRPNNNSLKALYQPSAADISKGNVTLTISTTANSNCLTVSDQLEVNITPVPSAKLPTEIFAFEGEPTTLSPEVAGEELQYLWTPNLFLSNNTIKNPVFNGQTDVKYTLTVTGKGGCSTTASIQVKMIKPVKIPNSFSPNSDGVNDTWVIGDLANYPGISIQVFNRFGALVYSGTGSSLPWDGTFNGKALPVGVYYYLLRFVNFSKPQSGPLTIIK